MCSQVNVSFLKSAEYIAHLSTIHLLAHQLLNVAPQDRQAARSSAENPPRIRVQGVVVEGYLDPRNESLAEAER